MRLIDADAEIAKIEQEIQRALVRIKEWEDNREDRGGYYNVNAKVERIKSNINQARAEIACLETYSTAYDLDTVVEKLETKILDLKEQLLYTKDEDMVRLRCKMHGINEAIETIKAGGINE